jgi:hypothetical protein
VSKVNNGVDTIARQSAGFLGASYMTGAGGLGSITATSVSLTGVTGPTGSSGGPPHNTGTLIGMTISTASRYGVILQHTAGPPAVITVDQWYDPTSATGAVGSNPATGTYLITPGNFAAAWIGLTVATRTIAAADPFLTNDGTTVSEIWNGSGGLNRAMGSYSHTVGTATYSLAKTFTSTGTDPASSTVHRIGIFQHAVNAAPTTTTTGMLVYETNLPSDAIITNNGTDSLTITETVTIS